MSQKKILVKTGGSGSGTQETYNAIQNNYQWSFNLPALTPGSISENTSKLRSKALLTNSLY